MVQGYVDNRVLSYTKNIHAAAENMDNGNTIARVRADDTFMSAEMEIEVKIPDLKIVSIQGRIIRSFAEECKNNVEILKRAIGMRVGAGVTRLVKETIGGPNGCNVFADMILEGCNAMIMGFTVEELDKQLASETDEGYEQVLRDMLEHNPRVASCIAFTEGNELRRRLGV
ncbi:MAG: DUF2889 domain-containing protein [Thermodesulfobacteriota bacterium]